MKKLTENHIKINQNIFSSLEPAQLRNLSYKNKIKGLKYFRKDFKNYDLRKKIAPQTKAKINRLLENFIDMSIVPMGRVFRPSLKNLKATQEYMALDKNWIRFIIELNSYEKIYFKNGELRIKSKYLDKRRKFFNHENLIKSTDKEVARIFKGEKFDNANIMCGTRFLGGNKSENVKGINFGDDKSNILKRNVVKNLNYLMNAYGIEENDNYYKNWLSGIELVNLKNQDKPKKFKSQIGYSKKKK